MTIGGGKEPNYTALLLFLAGLALGMVAVYLSVNRSDLSLPLVFGGLLLAVVGSFLIAAKKGDEKKG